MQPPPKPNEPPPKPNEPPSPHETIMRSLRVHGYVNITQKDNRDILIATKNTRTGMKILKEIVEDIPLTDLPDDPLSAGTVEFRSEADIANERASLILCWDQEKLEVANAVRDVGSTYLQGMVSNSIRAYDARYPDGRSSAVEAAADADAHRPLRADRNVIFIPFNDVLKTIEKINRAFGSDVNPTAAAAPFPDNKKNLGEFIKAKLTECYRGKEKKDYEVSATLVTAICKYVQREWFGVIRDVLRRGSGYELQEDSAGKFGYNDGLKPEERIRRVNGQFAMIRHWQKQGGDGWAEDSTVDGESSDAPSVGDNGNTEMVFAAGIAILSAVAVASFIYARIKRKKTHRNPG